VAKLLTYLGLPFFFLILVNFSHSQVNPNSYRDDSLPVFKRTVYISDNRFQTKLDTFVNDLLRPYMQSPQNCGISIGISIKGNKYFYNYGEPRRGVGVLTTTTTIYELGAMTNVFCGLLLAQAVTENKISLEDDIRKYLPGNFPFANLEFRGEPIRIKHLANHSSGLPNIPADLVIRPGYDSLNPYQHYSKQMIFDYLKSIKLNEPGNVFQYSSLGIAVLGVILETVYGEPFDDLVKEKITGPFDLKNTSVNLSPDQQKNLAFGYTDSGEPTPPWDMGDWAATGEMHSTTANMLTLMDFHLKSNEMNKLIFSPVDLGRETLGLTWFIKRTKQGNTLIWHNGGTFGFSGFCGFLKEKESSVTVLANSGTNVDYIAIAILNYLQDKN
jgi:CubicO group peptidase (beta-lactamase class C family)